MSEHDEEVALRSQLSALVGDRPAALSPAPLVIAKVRRSRRRRAAAGALVAALAVTGGTLLGLNGGSASPRPPAPAKPGALCRVPLPTAWAKALAAPANGLPHGMTLIAATDDGSRVFVQDGNRVLQLTDHFRTRRTVMTLPPLPSGFTGASWSVSGTFDGTWLTLALLPEAHNFSYYLGLYAWNASTGATRTVLAAVPHPTQEIPTWTAGAGRAAWSTATFNADGGIEDGSEKPHLMTLSSGREQAVGGVSGFVGDTMLVVSKDGSAHGVSLSTGAPVALPAQVAASFTPNHDFGYTMGDGSAFAWGRGVASTKGANAKEAAKDPVSWNVWWPGNPSVVRVTAPSGSYVEEVVPMAPGYAVGLFHRDDQPIASETGATAVLVDLRNGSAAPLTTAQEKAMESLDRSMPTANLPRLPHC